MYSVCEKCLLEYRNFRTSGVYIHRIFADLDRWEFRLIRRGHLKAFESVDIPKETCPFHSEGYKL